MLKYLKIALVLCILTAGRLRGGETDTSNLLNELLSGYSEEGMGRKGEEKAGGKILNEKQTLEGIGIPTGDMGESSDL